MHLLGLAQLPLQAFHFSLEAPDLAKGSGRAFRLRGNCHRVSGNLAGSRTRSSADTPKLPRVFPLKTIVSLR